MDADIDIEMIIKVARSAANKVAQSSSELQRDLEQDLLLHVLERRDLFDRYILIASELSEAERQNKLFVALVRWGSKKINVEINHFRQTRSTVTIEELESKFDTDRMEEGFPQHQHPYVAMTEEQIIGVLPFILLEDMDVPADHAEEVSIVRSVVASCTPAQREVLYRLARGMNYEEIGEELGIHPHTAAKRYQRARLHERCDRPVYGHRNKP